MRKINLIGFIVIMTVLFIMLLIKAFLLPVVTDEAITYVQYVRAGIFDIVFYTDHYPNNHILNSLITKLFVSIFGDGQVIIRLPNILSFLVYGLGIYRLNKAVLKEDSGYYFLPATLLFVSNPYLLDFFVLCRGYGMSCALALLSLSYLVTGCGLFNKRHITLALILAALASYANFTLLIFWVAVTIVVTLYHIGKRADDQQNSWRSLGIVIAISVLYAALIFIPIMRMHENNEFRFWTSQGFYKDTIIPLINYARDGSDIIPNAHIIAFLIFIIITTNIIYIIIRLKQHRQILPSVIPVMVSTGILILTTLINIIQCQVLSTPNLHGRTALFFYPLTIAVMVAFMGWSALEKYRRTKMILSVALLFICVIHISGHFRFKWVRDAWHSVNTFEVLNYINTKENGKPVILKAHRFLYHSFHYYEVTGKYPWLKLADYDENFDINTTAIYYYIFEEDLKNLQPDFEPVRKFGENRLLLKRNKNFSVKSENK